MCEKDAHTKEKSTKKKPEIHGEAEDLLKKEMEAEIKREEKKERRSKRLVNMLTSGASPCNKEGVIDFAIHQLSTKWSS